jgi:hypothetical protein
MANTDASRRQVVVGERKTGKDTAVVVNDECKSSAFMEQYDRNVEACMCPRFNADFIS